jgi:hypothetical protein
MPDAAAIIHQMVTNSDAVKTADGWIFFRMEFPIRIKIAKTKKGPTGKCPPAKNTFRIT